MFKNTRLKLTGWYLLIIMSISILFSIFIYHGATIEVERSLRAQEFRIYTNRNFNFDTVEQQLRGDPQVLSESQDRIKLTLFLLNLAILIISGGAGYFLAGRTLRPIEEMLEDQKRFIADASHELRTPLTSLKSEIEVYLRGKKNISLEISNLLKSNLEEIDSLQILSNDLLELAQYENKISKVSLEKIPLIEIIEQANKKVALFAKQRNISIKTKIGKEIVKGDRQTLCELFSILLDNAIKYSSVKSSVDIQSKKDGKFILISVSDKGIGIASEDIEHIFDRFFRADLSRSKENISGYGLGLSIAKKIVDAHNGTIGAKSKIGKGTVITVKIQSA